MSVQSSWGLGGTRRRRAPGTVPKSAVAALSLLGVHFCGGSPRTRLKPGSSPAARARLKARFSRHEPLGKITEKQHGGPPPGARRDVINVMLACKLGMPHLAPHILADCRLEAKHCGSCTCAQSAQSAQSANTIINSDVLTYFFCTTYFFRGFKLFISNFDETTFGSHYLKCRSVREPRTVETSGSCVRLDAQGKSSLSYLNISGWCRLSRRSSLSHTPR